MDDLLNIALKAAKAAGDVIMKYYDNYKITYKEDKSPLTSADLASNEQIFLWLSQTKIPICSEEAILEFSKRDYASKFWLVDPLDGTKEFIARNGQFCVCIALIEFGRPILSVIYAPQDDEIFYSSGNNLVYKNGEIVKTKSQGLNYIFSGNYSHSSFVDNIAFKFNLEIKRCGSALKFCKLAQGIAALYPRFYNSYIWDIAAGDFLLTQSGGMIFSLKTNESLKYDKENLKNDFFLALNSTQIPNLHNITKFIQDSITF